MDNNTLYCRYCGKPIEADAEFCTHCGNLQTSIKSPKNPFFKKIKQILKKIFLIFIIIISLCLLGVLGSWLFEKYLANKWKNYDQELVNIVKNDISKCDSIAELFFQLNDNYSSHTSSIWNYSCNLCNEVDGHETVALQAIRYAAEKGNSHAQFRLATLYAGLHYEKGSWKWYYDRKTMFNESLNYERAAYWYQLSANQGHRAALYNLGLMYINGEGVEKDQVLATKYIQKAAELGDDYAQLSLGNMYRDGDIWRTVKDSVTGKVTLIFHEKPDIDKAIEWWKKAAAQGNMDAKKNLEKIY